MSEEAGSASPESQPAMLTPKQEAFARAYIETGNASEAYRRAGYSGGNPKTVNEAASRLLRNSKVLARLGELRAAAANRHDVTIHTLTRELDEDRKAAREANQYSAAISAVMGKAKLHGLIVDRAKVEVATHEDALRALQELVEPQDERQERTNGASVH
jgi:phage terminase small subunit